MMLELLILVQLVIESLPISSSSHYRIVEMIMQRMGFVLPPLPAHFDHLLHGPTLVVLAVFFRREWLPLVRLMIKKRIDLIVWLRGNGASYALRVMFKISSIVFIATLIPVFFWYGVMPFLPTISFFSHAATMLFGFGVTMMLLFSLRWCDMFAGTRVQALPSTGLPSSLKLRRTGRINYLLTLVSFDKLRTSAGENVQEKACQHVGGASHVGGVGKEALVLRSPAQLCEDGRLEGYERVESIVYAGAILGLAQAAALVLPGLSRFASTYVVARWLNFAPRRAFQVCFLIQMPLIVASFFINGLRGLVHFDHWRLLCTASIGASFLFGTLLAYVGLCVVGGMVFRGTLWKWGWYLIAPMVVVLALMMR